MLTPLLLVPTGPAVWDEFGHGRRNAEWIAQFALVSGASWWIFLSANTAGEAFLVLPPLLWGAARLGALRTMISALMAAVLATVGTLHGHGELGSISDPQHRQWALQSLLAVICLATLILVLSGQARDSALAAAAEREDALAEAQRLAIARLVELGSDQLADDLVGRDVPDLRGPPGRLRAQHAELADAGAAVGPGTADGRGPHRARRPAALRAGVHPAACRPPEPGGARPGPGARRRARHPGPDERHHPRRHRRPLRGPGAGHRPRPLPRGAGRRQQHVHHRHRPVGPDHGVQHRCREDARLHRGGDAGQQPGAVARPGGARRDGRPRSASSRRLPAADPRCRRGTPGVRSTGPT